MTRRLFLVIAAVAIIGAIGARGHEPVTVAQEATPSAPAPVAITSEVLVHTQPVAVDNPALSLGRVTIMPGAVIPLHIHPGTQIAIVVQGELTYTVFTGEMTWFRAGEPNAAPTPIEAGDTVTLHAGDTLIETPGSVHEGRNDGAVPLVIYLSSLFPVDAPRSTIVEATPVSGA